MWFIVSALQQLFRKTNTVNPNGTKQVGPDAGYGGPAIHDLRPSSYDSAASSNRAVVIFCHGFETHRGRRKDAWWSTWMCEDNQFWPRQQLPPEFRLLSVCWNFRSITSPLLMSVLIDTIAGQVLLKLLDALDSLDDLGAPIQLVGHSVGCLVLKQVIYNAFELSLMGDTSEAKKARSFIKSLVGAVFYEEPPRSLGELGDDDMKLKIWCSGSTHLAKQFTKLQGMFYPPLDISIEKKLPRRVAEVGGAIEIISRKLKGYAPIHVYALKGDTEAVKALISSGVDKDLAMEDGTTPLYLAAKNNQVEVVRALCDAGADKCSNIINTGDTPIHIAAREGHEEVVRYLISRGVDKNLATDDFGGATPMYMAAWRNRVEVVRYRLRIGADAHRGCTNGFTPIHTAALRNFLEVTKELLASGVDKDVAMENGATALYLAAERCGKESVSYLLSIGADMNRGETVFGYTPLCIAVMKHNTECVYELLKAGADKNRADNNGKTPLDHALEKGFVDCVDLLRGD